MLGKEKEAEAKVFPVGLNDAFEKQLKKVQDWIDSQPNVDILDVNYADVVANPDEEFDAILGFLDFKGEIEEMKKVVNKSV